MRSEAQKRADKKYREKMIKQLSINFYDGSGLVAKRLDALKQEHGLKSRGDVVRMLLRNHTMPNSV